MLRFEYQDSLCHTTRRFSNTMKTHLISTMHLTWSWSWLTFLLYSECLHTFWPVCWYIHLVLFLQHDSILTKRESIDQVGSGIWNVFDGFVRSDLFSKVVSNRTVDGSWCCKRGLTSNEVFLLLSHTRHFIFKNRQVHILKCTAKKLVSIGFLSVHLRIWSWEWTFHS